MVSSNLWKEDIIIVNNLIPLLLFFLITTLSHGVFLIYAKIVSSLQRKTLEKVHYIVNGILWMVLLLWIIIFQFTASSFSTGKIQQTTGAIFFVLGLFLSIKSYSMLGLRRAMGSRFFIEDKERKIQKGLYRRLKNPMYDGFVLIFVGLALFLGINADYYLAIFSFIFLNVFLATIEAYRKPKNGAEIIRESI